MPWRVFSLHKNMFVSHVHMPCILCCFYSCSIYLACVNSLATPPGKGFLCRNSCSSFILANSFPSSKSNSGCGVVNDSIFSRIERCWGTWQGRTGACCEAGTWSGRLYLLLHSCRHIYAFAVVALNWALELAIFLITSY
jgi:hypothetical protein